MSDPKIIVALDYASEKQALNFVSQLNNQLCRLKIGKEMFTHFGPKLIEKIQSKDFEVFLDLKYHDIPNTTAKACEAAADLGVWMINIHAGGGRKMMEAAANAIANHKSKPHLIAVTVLTSLSQQDLIEVGINESPAVHALKLAKLAQDSGINGIVCSAMEASTMRQQFTDGFLLITPGIRTKDDKIDDQQRIMTPLDAIKAGSNYLVIGRPITQSDNPMATLLTINSDIS